MYLSFGLRLITFAVFYSATNSFVLAVAFYFVLDQIVVDQILRSLFSLEQVEGGLDMQLRIVNTCFYVVMDRKISSIKEIKRQILSSAIGMDRFQSCLVEVLGKLYYKRINGEQLRDEIARAFVEEEAHMANEAELT